jgi:hypothetical protein
VLAQGGAELVPLELPVPHAPGLTGFEGRDFDPRVAGAARIYPYHLDSGGLFLAKLRRSGDAGEARVDDGWSAVPTGFDESEREAVELLPGALEVVAERYGIDAAAHTDWGWMVRGGRAWLHTVGEWPLESWADGRWRPVSVGLRALEFDGRGRPRPTNDFLRMAERHVAGAVVDLSEADLRALIERQPIPTDLDLRGPVALRYGGDVVGRGAVTARGVVSEIPKARAADLERVLPSAAE